jgi:hypothetical protein
MGVWPFIERGAFGTAIASLALAASAAQTSSELQGKALELAHGRAEAAVAAFDRRAAECIKLQSRPVDPAVFQGMQLSARQVEVAAYVLSERAAAACEEPAKGALLIAIGNYREVARHYGQPVDDKLDAYERRVFEQQWQVIEKEAAEYLALPQAQRRRLEALPELQQPFDFVGMLSKLRGAP